MLTSEETFIPFRPRSDDGDMLELKSVTMVGKIELLSSLREILRRLRFVTLTPRFRSLRCFSRNGSVVTLFSTGRIIGHGRTQALAATRVRRFIGRLIRDGFAKEGKPRLKVSNIFGTLRFVDDDTEVIDLEALRKVLPAAARARYDLGAAPRCVLRFKVPEHNTHVDAFYTGKCTMKSSSEEDLRSAATALLSFMDSTPTCRRS